MLRVLAQIFLLCGTLFSCKPSSLSVEQSSLSLDTKLTILSWNVQNLFDDQDDGREYEEYKQATGLWNTRTFYNKLEKIYLFLNSLESLPDILIFQEVEKPEIVKFLFERFFKKHPYETIVGTTKPQLQVVVASRIALQNIETFYVDLEETHLRQAIKLSLDWQNLPISLVAVHFKSWARSQSERNACIRHKEITALGQWLEKDQEQGRLVLIMGDLNARRQAICPLAKISDSYPLRANLGDSALKVQDLVAEREDGTYFKQACLTWLDGILLAGELGHELNYEIRVHNDVPYLCTPQGFPDSYQVTQKKGFSDHFPFSLVFKMKRSPI